ncbi:flagellar filament capping protein FliD [Imhoffiella purpurea]|uniref:Flagellar hook-associated protein 2 n=1 Tax=Imhoffiella purpurea TaxID=1249627 RepID=W9V977_9GAMM|nr:flagellar filament capping protein FliD [Imhoffiella purpurea]EXJ13416.1 Flagellar hook-associated protein FliD [Imhoffiella purpurea]
MATNNIVNSLGIGSGIDLSTLVSQLVEVERAAPQERIDKRTETLKAQISGYGQLTSALDTLQTAVKTLSDGDLFNARSVAVPDSDSITAESLEAGAQTGSYSIKVNQVATAQSLAMTAVSQNQRDAALGKSGTMSISFGEWSYTGADNDIPDAFTVNADRAALSIEIEETDSLDTIAQKINDQASGVQASVLKVDGKFQLMLTASSGQSNAMEITVDDASLDQFAFNSANHANVTETQQGQDAILEVNGLAVTRESNQIDDVIEGFKFTLNKPSTEALSFSITEDKSAAETAIREFVDAYNSFHETVEGLVGYTRDEDKNWVRGDLAGDNSARMMINRLRESIGRAVPGLESGFTSVVNVGIRTERDGTLSIKEEWFAPAFNDHFKLFESLFSPSLSVGNTSVAVYQGSFASKAVSGNYQAEITRDPTQGQVVGGAIGHDFGLGALDASGGGYSFKINVNGAESDLIELTGNYGSADELRADLQSRINGDSNLKAAFGAVDVLYDSTSNAFSFVSREYGSISKVGFTEVGANMGTLGISATGAEVHGNSISQAGFDSATDAFTTSLDGSAGDYSFKIGVDGVESDLIQLSGTYASAEEVRAELQSLLDTDAQLVAAGVGVDVSYDADTDRFSFVSRSTGLDSDVDFTEVGADIGKLGIEDVLTGTSGVNVAGTINGVAGFGAGNVLLPNLDSDAYGLNLSVKPGAKAQGQFDFSFTRGFAGELSKLIDELAGSSGLISVREENVQSQLDALGEDQTRLDARMDKVSARLTAQFIAMESILDSLDSTSGQLEGLVDRLPFTSKT